MTPFAQAVLDNVDEDIREAVAYALELALASPLTVYIAEVDYSADGEGYGWGIVGLYLNEDAAEAAAMDEAGSDREWCVIGRHLYGGDQS